MSKEVMGCASWPSRRTGGMLPNCRLGTQARASWVELFSSASSSCCRMYFSNSYWEHSSVTFAWEERTQGAQRCVAAEVSWGGGAEWGPQVLTAG